MRLSIIVIGAAFFLTSLSLAGHAQEEAMKETASQPQPGAQSLPDAPMSNMQIVQAQTATGQRISIWRQQWDYGKYHISNREVLANKSYLLFVTADVLVDTFDAEMSHEGFAHHRCVEGAQGLPPIASRWSLYGNNIPEEAAVIVVGFVETKIKMPRWLIFTGDVYPVESHLRAGLKWYQDCW
jgi:hypothetical protein